MSAEMSLAARGVLLLLFRGLLHTVQLGVGRTLKDLAWPYFRIMAAACLLASIPIAGHVWVQKTPMPERAHVVWVVLRGLLGAGSFVCSVLAVQVGAPLGDVEALRSINMVASAVLGRVFLQEAVSPFTAVALGCSALGALFISQPEAVFGSHSNAGKGDLLVGHALAVASGVCNAGVFVASRKAPGTSVWVQTLSACLMSSVVAFGLPAVGVVQDYTLAPLAASPWQAAGLFALVFGITFTSTAAQSAAAQWCTAAQSAIVSTSSGMGFGFAAQAELFGEPVDRLSLLGAALMFSGVLVTALTQGRSQPPAGEPGDAGAGPDAKDVEMGGARHLHEVVGGTMMCAQKPSQTFRPDLRTLVAGGGHQPDRC
mmetsp:Transcript_93313/g.285545  ORF Transcript_93313/g.285545 Transcript_93313/m.285545 type:complete len:371 (-) Transcript_93313:123-1235(-)